MTRSKYGIVIVSCPRNLHIMSSSFRLKISPSPPFDYAQGMLFQRGVESCGENSPLKKGDRGGFEFELSRCHRLKFSNKFLRH